MNPISEIVQRADRFQQRTPWLAFPVAVWKKFGDRRRFLRGGDQFGDYLGDGRHSGTAEA